MRGLTAAALSLSLVPAAGCINFDVGNGEPNVFQAEIDANGAGFGKKNIDFKQIVVLDPLTDEQRAGATAIDEINFEPIQIEFHYLREDMIRLEALLQAGNEDPRGQADPTVFQVGDPRNQPYVIGMFVTFTRKEEIIDAEGDVQKIETLETRPAFCNFIDPLDEDSTGCFKFDPNVTEGLENLIGSVAGVGDGELTENTISATFQDLIVYDEALYAELFEAALLAGEFPDAEDLAPSILVRIARDEPGKAFIFNANLGIDAE